MADPVFDAVLRRERDDAYQALVEMVRLIVDDLDDDPLEDPASYVVSAGARTAVVSAMATAGRPRPTPQDRTVETLDDLVAQLLAEGHDLESAALGMTGPDYQNAHQGRAIGLRQAGLRLADLIARTDLIPVGAAR